MVLKGNTNSFYTITSKVTFEFLLWSINDLFINLVKVDLQMALVKPLYLKSSSQVCQRNCSLRWNWTLKLYLSPDFFIFFYFFHNSSAVNFTHDLIFFLHCAPSSAGKAWGNRLEGQWWENWTPAENSAAPTCHAGRQTSRTHWEVGLTRPWILSVRTTKLQVCEAQHLFP